jgi:flagellar basal body rod protein FlgG
MDILSIGQQGLSHAQAELEKSAQSIAGAALPQAQPPPQDSVNLSDQMVSLLEAKNAFAANLTVVRTGNEMWRQTLNLLA